MKYLFLFTFLLTSAALLAQQKIPSTIIKKLDGRSADITEHCAPGKTIAISFWATWCSPCKKELDAIADLYPEWQDKYNVELIAVSIDTRRALAKVGPMVEAKGWEYTVLADCNKDLFNALSISAVPHTIVANENCEVVYSHSGYLPGDEYELEEVLKKTAAGTEKK